MFVEDVNDGTIGVARWAGIRVPRTNSQVIADTHMRIIAKGPDSRCSCGQEVWLARAWTMTDHKGVWWGPVARRGGAVPQFSAWFWPRLSSLHGVPRRGLTTRSFLTRRGLELSMPPKAGPLLNSKAAPRQHLRRFNSPDRRDYFDWGSRLRSSTNCFERFDGAQPTHPFSLPCVSADALRVRRELKSPHRHRHPNAHFTRHSAIAAS